MCFAFFLIFSCLEEEYVGPSNDAFERGAGFFSINCSGYSYSRHKNTDTACMDSSVIMPRANKESVREKKKPRVKSILYSNHILPFNF